jgi:spore germination protein GerM
MQPSCDVRVVSLIGCVDASCARLRGPVEPCAGTGLEIPRRKQTFVWQEGPVIDMRSGIWSRAVALVIVLGIAAGCGHRGASLNQSQPTPADHQITVYYCKAGSDTLIALHYTAASRLEGAALAQYVVSQLVAGPPEPNSALLVFPPDTRARAAEQGGIVDVDLSGSITKRYSGGAGDEAGLFKALTFTLTELPGVTGVQVRLNGRVEAALPGGHLELDEPLTRETFAQ